MGRLAALLACCAALGACGGTTTSTHARDPVRFASVGAHRSLTVVETHVPRQLTDTEFARNEPKMLRLALHARNIRERETRYQGRRALRVTYTLNRKRVVQYFVRKGELMLVSTYTYR